MIEIVPITAEYTEGFHACLDSVARERRYLGFVEAPSLESVRAFVEANIAADVPQFVALAGGEVVGWCDISPKTREGFRHCGHLGIGVHDDFRGQGVGTRLLAATVEKARAQGLERIELEVFASNTDAIRLYERQGFALEGRQQKARKIDGQYDDILCMARLFV